MLIQESQAWRYGSYNWAIGKLPVIFQQIKVTSEIVKDKYVKFLQPFKVVKIIKYQGNLQVHVI